MEKIRLLKHFIELAELLFNAGLLARDNRDDLIQFGHDDPSLIIGEVRIAQALAQVKSEDESHAEDRGCG
jgi:hypothetical protein